MANSKQSAGDNSNQLVVAGDLNIATTNGISLSDANELMNLHTDRLKAEFTLEARNIAESKIKNFEKKLINELNTKDLLDNLKNAGFQQNIFDASRAVACSDSNDSEDFLVGLLVERAKDSTNQSVKIAISKAIQIADQLDKSSLNGLTAEWALVSISCKVLDFGIEWELFKSIQAPFVEEGLPNGTGWQDDLELLDLMRIESNLLGRIDYYDFAQKRFSPHLVVGVSNDAINDMQDEINSLAPELKRLIIKHPLKHEYKMLNAKSLDDFNSKLNALGTKLEENEILSRLVEINNFGSTDNEAVVCLTQNIKDDAILLDYANWWNSIHADRITSSGKVIGFLNAKRYILFDNKGISGLLSN
jgi:hypothetical protein